MTWLVKLDAGVWHGEALGKDNKKVVVTYSFEKGLEYISK